MTDTIELQACEHCSKEFPIETMRLMSDCWFCEGCTDDFQRTFDACDHKWSPHIDEMGDTGRYCERCSGFLRDEISTGPAVGNEFPNGEAAALSPDLKASQRPTVSSETALPASDKPGEVEG